MKRVRRHLDRCPDCTKELARLSELKTLLAEGHAQPQMDATPEFFWSQIEGRIKGESAPRQRWQTTFQINWPSVLGWASATVAIAFLAAFVWMQTWPAPQQVAVVVQPPTARAQVDYIVTKGPEIYAESYYSKQSGATIIWTEGMPVISLEL
jgi:anti-sigma factor RsiW